MNSEENLLDEELVENKIDFKFNQPVFYVFLAFVGIGYILKVFHLPGGDILMVGGSAATFGYSMSATVFKQSRNRLSILLSIFGIIWSTYLSVFSLFSGEGVLRIQGLIYYLGILSISFILFLFLNSRKFNKIN